MTIEYGEATLKLDDRFFVVEETPVFDTKTDEFLFTKFVIKIAPIGPIVASE